VLPARGDSRFDLRDLKAYFGDVELAAETDCAHCMPFENHRGVFLGRGPRFSFRAIWAGERIFI
jgi:hypothetical protein